MKILTVILFISAVISCGAEAEPEDENESNDWYSDTIEKLSPTETEGNILYVSAAGDLDVCSETQPCSLSDSITKTLPGDLILLRGGVYTIDSHLFLVGGATYESYPEEWAVLDGSPHIKGGHINLIVSGDYTTVRLLEIRNMPRQGLWITGNHNVFEGLNVHSNAATGIHIFSNYDLFPYGVEGSFNTIIKNWVHDNSDVGYTYNGLANGGNADGIAVSSGHNNVIHNNYVNDNSDDGIDTWRSTYSIVSKNIVYGSGLGDGNGNGIKAGGTSPSRGTMVINNEVYGNTRIGITNNSGAEVVMYGNESYDNGFKNYYNGPSGIMINNE